MNSRHRSGTGRDLHGAYVFLRNDTSFAFIEIVMVAQGIGIGDCQMLQPRPSSNLLTRHERGEASR
jgi:hypothetical protein